MRKNCVSGCETTGYFRSNRGRTTKTVEKKYFPNTFCTWSTIFASKENRASRAKSRRRGIRANLLASNLIRRNVDEPNLKAWTVQRNKASGEWLKAGGGCSYRCDAKWRRVTVSSKRCFSTDFPVFARVRRNRLIRQPAPEKKVRAKDISVQEETASAGRPSTRTVLPSVLVARSNFGSLQTARDVLVRNVRGR